MLHPSRGLPARPGADPGQHGDGPQPVTAPIGRFDNVGRPDTSLAAILEYRTVQPERWAMRFLVDGTGNKVIDWTYDDLAVRADRVAAELFARGITGGRVVLALEPGLTYMAGLFGLMRAGATVVPSFPPTARRTWERLRSIMLNCAPGAVLVDAGLADRIDRFRSELTDLERQPQWIVVDDGLLERPREAPPSALRTSEPALLQYTSGSTGAPKGVVLSHFNLINNCATIERQLGEDPERLGCTWLPPYHDMGLMGGVMLALHGGWPFVMMSPAHFAQRPYRWLKAISDHRANITLAPNFALDLCTSTVTDEELATLDLSGLKQMFCGSEPVTRRTLDAFAARFGPVGYDPSIVVPCYGLAEATLFVTGKPRGRPLRAVRLEKSALDRGVVRGTAEADDAGVDIVGCGLPALGHSVLVVDPNSRLPMPHEQVGEIWVHGPNVACGYLHGSSQSAKVFDARLAGDADTSYLRTGDLGFLLDGELFVTGRVKDVIIIAGRNLYPQDIEESVRRADSRLRRAVAFPADDHGRESLVVVTEVKGRARDLTGEIDRIRRSIVAAVTADHGVRPFDVVLSPVNTIPVTTSGKLQRNATRLAYQEGLLRRFTETPAQPDSATGGHRVHV